MNPYGQPPIPWQIVPAHPRPYFFNPVTRVTQWEPPAPNDFELEPHVPVQITMPGHAAPGAASGIPMPDPDTEPERYAAWLEVTAHIESGDRNTASFSGLKNAEGNGLKGEIRNAPAGIVTRDCDLYPQGLCLKGDRCKFIHNKPRSPGRAKLSSVLHSPTPQNNAGTATSTRAPPTRPRIASATTRPSRRASSTPCPPGRRAVRAARPTTARPAAGRKSAATATAARST